MVARLLPFLLATPGALGKKVSHDEAKCVMEGRSIARARAPRHAPPFFKNKSRKKGVHLPEDTLARFRRR